MQAERVNPLAQRVMAERKMRGWSQRDAAREGGTSNQTWSNFETSGKVTAAMQSAVAQAFGWPANWSTEPPELPLSQLDAVLDQLERQARALEVVMRVVARLDALGVDVSELPAAATLMRRVAQ